MPNILDADGLETKTQEELTTELVDGFKAIYGVDITVTPDSPDGQMIMIFVQSTVDVLDLLTRIYNSFDPNLAIGRILDQRVAINGIQRRAGTYTITPVTITVNQALTLYGLDDEAQEPFTVKDNIGNQFVLLETEIIGAAGAYILNFRALEPGEVLTVPNTITLPVTIVLGVDSINNPSSYTTLGVNEESDIALKIRRQKSVSIASQGYNDSLRAALLNINGVEYAKIYENVTGTTDGDGIPSHSIWVIVGGSAENEDIADAIYRKRNAGCGMKGSESYEVEQADGSFFEILWDELEVEEPWVEFDATSIDGVGAIDTSAIADYIVENYKPDVYETINVNDLATIVQEFDNNCLVTAAGFSTTEMGSYTPTLTPTAKNKQFVFNAAKINITVV